MPHDRFHDFLGRAHVLKSTYSGGGGDCLEVSDGHPTVVPVRDSKDPRGPKLAFRAEVWTVFVENLKVA